MQKIQIFLLVYVTHRSTRFDYFWANLSVLVQGNSIVFSFQALSHRTVNVTTSRPTGYNFVCLGHDISQFFSTSSWFFLVPEISFLIALKIIPRPSPYAFIQFNKTIGKPQMSHNIVQCHCETFSAAVSYL